MDNVPSAELTIEDVAKFLRDHLSIGIKIDRVPYEHDWTEIEVKILLEDEVIATSSATVRIRS